MNRLAPVAGALAALLLVLPAAAAPKTIADCESIADPDAYNRCLASFGPAARGQKFTEVPPDADARARSASRGDHARQARAGRSRHHAASHGRGRMRMTFDVRRR